MELSKQNTKIEENIAKEEEDQLAIILEQSKKENSEKEEMIKKNDQLMQMMKQIEEDKPEGWGLNKINADNVDQNNIMEIYAHNMQKALKKLELQ